MMWKYHQNSNLNADDIEGEKKRKKWRSNEHKKNGSKIKN